MFEIPTRASLSERTATAIRKAVEQGAWEQYLPGERSLCEIFKVSRPTIHRALHLLANDGWIDIRQGHRNRILARRSRGTAPRTHLVGLVAHEPISHLMMVAYLGILEVRAYLAEQGFATALLVCKPRDSRPQRSKLEEFIRENRVSCCVLLSVSKEVQQWFVGRSIPTLVIGSCHEAVKLPSFDVDYASVCRHAAGVFLRRGHRQMALIVPDTGLAGDLVSEHGFREAVEQSRHHDAHAHIVRHNGTPQSITTKMDGLFKLANAPTALLVSRTSHVFAVILYLMKRGRSVPDTVSLIARDQDMLFRAVDPPISHYHFEGKAYVQRLSRLILKLVSQDHLSLEPSVIFPKFFEGETVKELSD